MIKAQKSKLLFLFVFCNCIFNIYAQQDFQQQNTKQAVNQLYSTVGSLILESEDYLSDKKNSNNTVNAEVDQSNNQNSQKTNLQKIESLNKSLDSIDKKRIVFELLSKLGTLEKDNVNNLDSKSVIEDNFLSELSIIIGSNGSNKINLFNKIDKTNTAFGSAVLARIISEPLSGKFDILKRQAVIKLLLEDENLFDNLDKALKRIKTYENDVINLWNQQAQLDPALRAKVFYPKNSRFSILNKNAKSLQLSRKFQLFSFGYYCLAAPINLIANPLGYGQYCERFSDPNFNLIKDCSFFNLSAALSRKKFLAGLLLGSTIGGLNLYFLKQRIEDFKLYNSICYKLHNRVLSVKKYIKPISQIFNLTSNKTLFADGLKLYNNLSNFNNPDKISPEHNVLKELLKEEVFQEKPKWDMNIGNVLAAYTYIQDLKDHFIPAFESIGEIDACLSVVKLIKEHEDKSAKFCLVDFEDQKDPYISFKGLWNPLINIDKVVTEDITIGDLKNTNNILLTGPHGGGKSTFMKSIVYSICLGQTFGVAAATKANFSIFNKINSYVNIKEDLASGQSTFMAEKRRVDQIKNVIVNLDPEEKCFTIMDEVYKGTMEEEGARRLYMFGKDIAPVKNSLSMIATHFKYPAQLEDETNNFSNYHVGLDENPDSTFNRTFKLIKGKNMWWFNDSAKRKRYIDWLISIED